MIDFEKIYNIYFTDIYYFVLSLAKNKEVAEDVTSETFYKALKNIGKLEKEKSVKSYLFTIAKNSFYDYVKKNNHLISINDNFDFPDNESALEDRFIENELNSYLLESINLLNEPGQSIVKLRIFENLSFKEIGNLYERSQNWACVNFHRSKNKLKKIMEEKYGQI